VSENATKIPKRHVEWMVLNGVSNAALQQCGSEEGGCRKGGGGGGGGGGEMRAVGGEMQRSCQNKCVTLFQFRFGQVTRLRLSENSKFPTEVGVVCNGPCVCMGNRKEYGGSVLW
jgi:hypothetical protein